MNGHTDALAAREAEREVWAAAKRLADATLAAQRWLFCNDVATPEVLAYHDALAAYRAAKRRAGMP